jgi:hypothetical protein
MENVIDNINIIIFNKFVIIILTSLMFHFVFFISYAIFKRLFIIIDIIFKQLKNYGNLF